MSPEDALVQIEQRLLPPSPGQRMLSDEIREILAQVDTRYWLASMADAMVAAYLRDDLGEMHGLIGSMIARDQRRIEGGRVGPTDSLPSTGDK